MTDTIILYNDVTVIPIIAGIEYCNNNFPTGLVSKICDALVLDITSDPPFLNSPPLDRNITNDITISRKQDLDGTTKVTKDRDILDFKF